MNKYLNFILDESGILISHSLAKRKKTTSYIQDENLLSPVALLNFLSSTQKELRLNQCQLLLFINKLRLNRKSLILK